MILYGYFQKRERQEDWHRFYLLNLFFNI
jgi:hypothetical protein